MQMTNLIRRKVSQNRKRLVEGRYDLDLTYICNNIIAMGYPSDKPFQNLIRNRIESVSKFLNERHANEYKIFNLCIESDYDCSFFNDRVEKFEIEDHNPPYFEQIIEFCTKVDEWLQASPKNVAVIHCKAGKGRTGTMISNYLLHTKRFDSPFDAMNEFDRKRCTDSRGVTIPSQRRYIEYYSDYLKNNRTYTPTELKFLSLKIINGKVHFSSLTFQIMYRKTFDKFYKSKLVNSDISDDLFININDQVILKDDIKFFFFNKKKECVFSLSFNTFCLIAQNEFVSNEKSCLGDKIVDHNQLTYYLKKKQIDILFKNTKIDSDFEIEFKFELIPEKRLINETISPVLSPKGELKTNESDKMEHKTSSKENFDNASKQKKKFFKSNNKSFLPEFLSRHLMKRSLSETQLYSNNESSIQSTVKNDLKRSSQSSNYLTCIK